MNFDHRLGSVRERRDTLPETNRPGVTALPRLFPVFECCLTRLGERDVGPASQAKFNALASDRSAPDPLLSAGWNHTQDQAVLVEVLVGPVGVASLPDALEERTGQRTLLSTELPTILSPGMTENQGCRARPEEANLEPNSLNTRTLLDSPITTSEFVV